MKITIRYFPPYRDAVGVEWEELDVEGADIQLSVILRLLMTLHPSLEEYFDIRSDGDLRRQVIVASGSRVLKLSDPIDVSDGELKILPPIIGG